MAIFLFTLGMLVLTAGLVVASYLDRVYRELGRVSTRRTHEHLEAFEGEIEPGKSNRCLRSIARERPLPLVCWRGSGLCWLPR